MVAVALRHETERKAGIAGLSTVTFASVSDFHEINDLDVQQSIRNCPIRTALRVDADDNDQPPALLESRRLSYVVVARW